MIAPSKFYLRIQKDWKNDAAIAMSDYVDFFTSRIAIAALLAALLWRRYTARRDKFENQTKKGTPGTFPHIFPLLGSLPVSYLWKPRDFVLDG